MVIAHAVKKSRVNQSIREATLRLKVGKAKAASAASAGRLSSRLRSDEEVVKVAATAMLANHSGNAT